MPLAKKRKPSQTDDESSVSKRRKRSMHYDPSQICHELYNTIRNHKTEDGRLVGEAFIRAPKRRNDPDYYNVVSTPIDLLKIQHKLKSDDYEDIDLMTADVELMLNNAKSYYAAESQEYTDACELWNLYQETKGALLAQVFGDDVDPSNIEKGEDSKEASDEEDGEIEDEVLEEEEEEIVQEHVEEAAIQPASVEKPDGEDGDTTEPEMRRSLRGRPYKRLWTPKRARTKSVEERAPFTARSDQEGPAPASELEEPQEPPYEEVFSAVATAKDGDREIASLFRVLPSRTKYHDYYEIIKNPIDLRMIAQKIQGGQYMSLDEMMQDLFQLVHNAKTFNEPGSLIYRDAVTLKKVIQGKKTEIDQLRASTRPLRSERIRAKMTGPGGQKLSAIIAALPNESEEEADLAHQDFVSQSEAGDESGADDSVMGDEDPFWALFNSVRWQKNSLGQCMAEPFIKLPNRRIYPDYYEEIKNPMSLLKVQKKLKNGRYNSLEEVGADLDLMFSNAQKYNMDESKLYKDAVKLQSIMKAKKKELQSRVPDSLHCLSPSSLEVVPAPIPLQTFIQEEAMDHMSDIIMRPTQIHKSRRSLETSSTTSEESTSRRRAGRRPVPSEEPLKKRLWALYKAVHEYQVEGRHLVDIFMMLPSKKDYPDYYQVISQPIDMTMIENKIKQEKYTTEQALVSDFELMFNNARHYNEDGSQVYKDAEVLERVVRTKVRTHAVVDVSPAGKSSKSKLTSLGVLAQKLEDLYDSIRDYTDAKGRTLATPFMKLPLKCEYPDYYEVIKKPVDMQKVFQRMMAGQYCSLEDMVLDFVLMFDNACRYNEPDSLIYKDALTLQRVCLEKKQHLCMDEDSNEVPDVKMSVQALMTNLFISTVNNQDEEGRCYSDSFLELPPRPVEEVTGQSGAEEAPRRQRRPTFEQIKRNLDKGRYRRMDKFQEDMFEVFEYARKFSRTDSQLYEDAVELQQYFVRTRDELCKNGDVLLTPALSYTDQHLRKALEQEKKEKVAQEQKEDEEKKKSADTAAAEMDGPVAGPDGTEDNMEYQGQTYHVGDFVYIEPREKSVDPHIVCIERLWRDTEGQQYIYGIWFYRPKETYHLATRKFLEKEVFKSDFCDNVPMNKVLGKCYVMFVKEYFKLKPEDINDKDIFVCESRYHGKTKSFKKIKIWQVPRNEHVNIVTRIYPLVPVRVASVFADKSSKDIVTDFDESEQPLDKQREVVEIENYPNAEEGCKYYEQYETAAGWVKLGDYVYVRSDEDNPFITRVDKLWVDQGGDANIHGPYFIYPAEVEHQPTRMFYHQEVFRSSIEETNQASSIISLCAVLSYRDYTTCRPTEIPEEDVYLCESKYIEEEKLIKKLTKALTVMRNQLSYSVCDDEIYYFPKAIIPPKEASPLLGKVSGEELLLPDLMMTPSGPDTSFNESFNFGGMDMSEQTPSEPQESEDSKKRKAKGGRKGPSGYIVFAGEIRKEIQAANPDMSFGEISKVVGFKWRSLPKEEKERYEGKAKRITEDMMAKQEAADRALNSSLSAYPPSNSPMPDHRSVSPAPGQVQGNYPQGYSPYPSQQSMAPQMSSASATPQGMFPGMQNTAPGMPPTPGMTVAARPGAPGMMPHPQQSPYHPVGQTPGMAAGLAPHHSTPDQVGAFQALAQHLGQTGQVSTTSQQGQSQQPMGPPPPPPRPPSPMFVSVPARTQRLLHSEAYLRYIENLTPENQTVGDWQKSMMATRENTPLPQGKLPVHWLKDGSSHHENAANALWALRDLMMKDALTVSRTLDFSQLW